MIHNISIHGVVSIKIMQESLKEGKVYKGMPPFYHRKIIITDREGHDLELDLFGERERDLSFISEVTLDD
jgi:hypothetical protein